MNVIVTAPKLNKAELQSPSDIQMARLRSGPEENGALPKFPRIFSQHLAKSRCSVWKPWESSVHRWQLQCCLQVRY